MKKLIFNSFLLMLLLIPNIWAQSSSAENPYLVGEVFNYEGKFSKVILRGIEIADLTFKVERAPDSENYLVKAEAKSKGTLIKLFRFSFLQQIESTINQKDWSILKTIKHDVQNERVRDSEAIFNYENKQVTYIEIDPKDKMRPPRKVASQIEPGTHDYISGLYFLRTLPLAVGKSFELQVSDTGLVYRIPVRVTKREMQNTVLGKIWCFRVEPEVFGRNRLIEQEGSMIIWITDDKRRIPVRSQINTKLGKVEVKLKSMSYMPRA